MSSKIKVSQLGSARNLHSSARLELITSICILIKFGHLKFNFGLIEWFYKVSISRILSSKTLQNRQCRPNNYLKPVANVCRVGWRRRRELDRTASGRTEALFFFKIFLVFPYNKNKRKNNELVQVRLDSLEQTEKLVF